MYLLQCTCCKTLLKNKIIYKLEYDGSINGMQTTGYLLQISMSSNVTFKVLVKKSTIKQFI